MGERGGALWIAELSTIAGELGVSVRIMALPHSQLCEGRDLPAPVVEASPLLAEPPRPEPIDTRRPSSDFGGSYTRRTFTGAAFAIRSLLDRS
jgi:hypothetical protein